ncbi:MAG TPA: tetratricopeptide repeat protein [Gemmataceae bacterium]|nr:tetratricopeptide repeat protein [Gemmataceae bacterium]
MAITLLVYRHACANGFVDFDDDLYVANNPRVQAGLTAEGVSWAFTTPVAANWHPVTWLSLQLDADIYAFVAGKPVGTQPLKAWGFHLTNVLLHGANVVLLFVVLRWMTGAVWRSALVAALFAVHPLHVESVAWVSERKDVLSAFFGLLALLGYAWYAERPGWRRYGLVLVAFILGLMAKPMLVTLPFALLLLDYWPLRRFSPRGSPPGPHGEAPGLVAAPCSPRRLLLEKVPLLALSAGSCVVTWYVQQESNALQSWQDDPLGIRVGNALWSYTAYLGKTLWPTDLAIFYPHPGSQLAWPKMAAAALLLTTATAVTLAAWRRLPYLAVGWLWYLGTLVPVIGLVQAGSQGMADRFTYVPHIGLFILAVWGVADLAQHCRCREVAVALAGVVLAGLMAISWRQLGYWHDSVALWEHAVEVTRDNGRAHYHLAVLLEKDPRRRNEALAHYAETARLLPRDPTAHWALGRALEWHGRVGEAARQYAEAVRLKPSYAPGHVDLAVLLLTEGRTGEAIGHLRAALETDPDWGAVYFNLGRAFAIRENWPEAVTYFRQAVGLRPQNVRFRCSLAFALHKLGRTKEARKEYVISSRLEPDWLEVDNRRAWAAATDPDAEVRNGLLAVELAQQVSQGAANADPDYLDTLAAAYAEAGRFDRAAATARAAIRLASSADQRQQIQGRLRLYEQGLPFRARQASP